MEKLRLWELFMWFNQGQCQSRNSSRCCLVLTSTSIPLSSFAYFHSCWTSLFSNNFSIKAEINTVRVGVIHFLCHPSNLIICPKHQVYTFLNLPSPSLNINSLRGLLEKAMATHSSTLAWKIPWMEEPGRLQSMGSHRVGHDWSNLAAAAAARGLFVIVCFSFGLFVYFLRFQHLLQVSVPSC